MNIEVNLPWANGDDRYCAALMATSRGVVRIGQQPVPYRIDPPATIIPLTNPPEPTVGHTDVADRHTDLTPAQAELLADALEGDTTARDALIPLNIQVAAGDIDQWFDDLPHKFVEYDGDFHADVSWHGTPEGLPDALRVLALITRNLTNAANTDGEPPADVVAEAYETLQDPDNELTARLCGRNPDTCECRAAANTAWKFPS